MTPAHAGGLPSRSAADGRLTARVVGALWWDRHRGLEQIDRFLDRSVRRRARRHGFHPTTVKIMIDGVLENHTGALLEPYCDGCGGHDRQPRADLRRPRPARRGASTELDRLGFQVHLHAIGDRAVRNALDAVEAAREANGPATTGITSRTSRWSSPTTSPRFAELGVVANCQAYWAQTEPQMDELTIPFLGPDRADLQYPFGGLLRAGAPAGDGQRLGGHDRRPARADRGRGDAGSTRAPRQRAVPARPSACRSAEALDAFTAGSAYVNHDAEAGRLTAGARADLAVLDQDIRAIPGREIADASVVLTVCAGRIVHG